MFPRPNNPCCRSSAGGCSEMHRIWVVPQSGMRRLRMLLLLASMLCGLSWSVPVLAQENQPGSDELLNGLLELIEPKAEAPPAKTSGDSPDLRPQDVGISPADLDASSTNPLVAIQQSMAIAGGLLERGDTGSDTQQLQQDILTRLGELIDELNKPQSTTRNDDKNESSQSPPEANTTSSEETSQSESSSVQPQGVPGSGDASHGASKSGDSPAPTGPAASGKVLLTDPKALQQGVWGELPEKVREQIQSRMVEQFLPSYREEIETYYRSLLQQYDQRSK